MEVLEFFQCYYKMCASYVNGCAGCEAQGIDCELTTAEPEKLVAAVERWAKAHPEEAERERQKAERERQKAEHSEESSDLHAIIDALEDRIDKLDEKVSNEALIFREVSKRNQNAHRQLADRITVLEKDPVESMNEPKRTNKDVLLAAFPDISMDKYGIPNVCPNLLDVHYNCDKFENCLRCGRAYWLAEVEE